MINDLQGLIQPIVLSQFVEKYWAKQPLRIERGNLHQYDQLLPEADMEFVLQMACRSGDAVDILSEDNGPRTCRSHAQAIEAFRNGNSLRVDAIQRFSYPIASLCRSMEQTISSPVNVNMYLTPGAGKKALSRHYDTHDVFVLQIHGDKLWRLYDSPSEAPLEFLPLMRHESVREMKAYRLDERQGDPEAHLLTDEFVLKTGDCLYLPRGYWHEAESKPGNISCHLTIGIQPTTYLDVLNAAVARVAQSDSRLRQHLPFGFSVDASAKKKVADHIGSVVQSLPQMVDSSVALSDVISHFSRQGRPVFENHLLGPQDDAEASNLTVDTFVHVNEGAVCAVNGAISPPQFIFSSKEFAIDPRYEESCYFIARNRSFKVAELPGDLDDSQKIAFASQLMSEGLLSRSSLGLPARAVEKEGWIPIRIDEHAKTIQWLDFRDRKLSEPFLHQSVNKFRQENPSARTRVTTFKKLMQCEDAISPSGFIFHISRCGSTLLSNALKTLPNTIVISEPQPINALLGSIGIDAIRGDSGIRQDNALDETLKGLVRAYGQRRVGSEKALVIKFSSWNILHIARIRKLWPEVPCVIIVRDPAEVAVSCLDEAPGWMRWRHQQAATDLLGLNADELLTMSDRGFCARVIGAFLRCATTETDDRCVVIDYSDLNQASVEAVAEFFGIAVTDADREAIWANLSVYSKDPDQGREFADDRETKQSKVTGELRAEIDGWAKPQYELLCMKGLSVSAGLAAAVG